VNHPLESLRDYYLDCFRQSIAEARTHFDECAAELLLELPSLNHPEYCYRLYRADIIGKHLGENSVREVNVTAKDVVGWHCAFPKVASVDAALVWNGIEFHVSGVPAPNANLVPWATRWLDASDSRYDEAAEFQQVIHSITPPKATESGFTPLIPQSGFTWIISCLLLISRRSAFR
jgi:hypothetical protein